MGRGGWTVDQILPSHLIGPAAVINVEKQAMRNPQYLLQVGDLLKHERQNGRIPDGAIVLMNSGWSRRWPDKLRYLGTDDNNIKKMKFPAFSYEAAKWLTSHRNIYGVGVDALSLDSIQSMDKQAHLTFFAHNIFGLENLANVDQLPARGATVMALPMKMKGASGGPVRVVALWGDSVISTGTRLNAQFVIILTVIVHSLYLYSQTSL